VVAVWSLFALVAAEVFCTYARIPVRELYHVSGSGPAAGAGRALVFLNFPTALVALALLLVVADRLPGRVFRWAAAVSALLCCAVFWPGVVDQADLDARPVNAVAAAGVVLALALTAVAVRAKGLGSPRRARGDRVRIVLAALLVLLALPWLFADLGFFIGRVPPFRGLFMSTKLWAPLGEARLHPAVHVGHHHGADGLLLALAVLILSRTVGGLRTPVLKRVLAGYLAVLLVYGLANFANDIWYEQLVKRGVTGYSLPAMLLPSVTLPWGVLVIVAVAVYAFVFRRLVPGAPAVPSRAAVPVAAALAVAVVALVTVGATRSRAAVPRMPLAAAPTGGTIVFPTAPRGHWHLFALGTAGPPRPLTNESANDLAPALSPDGGRIVFQSSRDGNDELYVITTDGRVSLRLTHDSADDGEPAWSPDGERIAFVSDRDGNDELYVMRADGTRIRRLTHGSGVDEWPAWAADGRRLLFDSNRDGRYHLYSVRLDGGGLRRITDGRSNDRYPAPSPDGLRIAFESDRDGSYEVYLLGRSGSTPVRMTTGPGESFAPAWSPDGHSIVFLSDREGNDELLTVDTRSGRVHRLTSGQADKERPAWR
jgi:hypothetical protein